MAHAPGGVSASEGDARFSSIPALGPSAMRGGDSLTTPQAAPSSPSKVYGAAERPALRKVFFSPQMHTGSTMSAAWPGWTSTRWSPPPTMPLSKSGQSATEDAPPHGRIRDLEFRRSRTRPSSKSLYRPGPPRSRADPDDPRLCRVLVSIHVLLKALDSDSLHMRNKVST